MLVKNFSAAEQGLKVFGDVPGHFSNFSFHFLFSDLFAQIREGISVPNFVESSILKAPLSKICAVPFALQNGALFEGENRAKRCPRRGGGGGRGGQQRGQKRRKDTRKQVRHLSGPEKGVITLRTKGTLISEPRFSIPCEMRFFPREKGKTAFSKKISLKRPFSLSRVGKTASRSG